MRFSQEPSPSQRTKTANESSIPATRQPRLLMIEEVGDYLRVSPRTVRRMVSNGSLKAYRLGDRRRGLRFKFRDVETALIPVSNDEDLDEFINHMTGG